jgi:hypothetical protein
MRVTRRSWPASTSSTAMSPAAHSMPAITSSRVASPSSVVTDERPSIMTPSATSPSIMTTISAASTLNRRAM